MFARNALTATAVLGVVYALAVGTAPAQNSPNPSASEIVRALTPKAPRQAVRGLRAPNRGISVEGEPQTSASPSIDLQVNFEFDSSNLTNDAQLTLKTLGEALKAKELASLRFRIVGHTDSRGTAEYNMDLSQRRANAVRSYLMQFQSIAGDRLEAEGKGKTELIDAANPEAGINRRVQIITLGAQVSGR